ncbi:MAG: hypothetical protein GX755_01160 [Syntrophomonadaceae bacterium]|nr:hypothetical protein [Syntrophomonadaceae bacterium]
MRVKCVLNSENQNEPCVIPMDFRRHFISFVKTLLVNTPYYQRFNEEKPGYSPYVFGIEFAKVEGVDTEKQQMFIKPPVTVTFSTGLFELMTEICNSAIDQKGQLNVLGLKLSRINLLPLKQIKSNTVEFRIIGHAALRGENNYVDSSDRLHLEEAINTHLQKKVGFVNQVYSESAELPFSPIVVQDDGKLYKSVCQHYGGKITTLRGRITLSGSPDCLQFLYDYGLGVRTGQGFGLLEVIKQQ